MTNQRSAASDAEVLARIGSGDEAAFDELFSRYGGLVLGICLRFFGGNKAVAEEVAQEVWCRVARFAGGYSGGSVKAWLRTIASNTSITELNRTKPVVSFEMDEEGKVEDDFDLEEAVLGRELEARVRVAIDALPDAQRQALLLWVNHTESYEEIARQMGTSVSAVKSLLFRARQSILGKLREA